MPADPRVVFTEGMVVETPQGRAFIPGRAGDGDERAREARIDLARRRVPLDAVVHDLEGQGPYVVAVHGALDRPAEPGGRQGQVMTLRDFGEMTVAVAPGVSVTTVEQDWWLARACLAGQLGGGDG